MTEYVNNVKVIGNPTINGAVVSGFSANDYVETPSKITLGDGDKLEIGFLTKAPSASSTTTVSNIYNSNDMFILNISGSNVYYLTTNIKRSDNVLSNAPFSPYYIEPEEEVYCKFIIDNSTKKMTCGFSRDGINYEYVHRNTSPSLYVPLDGIMSIGKGSTKYGISPCVTYIDLSKCYIKINDEYVWKGAEVVSKNYVVKKKVRKYRKKFVLPVLTSNGTMGGSTFAVDCSTPKTAEYEMFNTGSAGTENVDTNPNAAPQWVSFYNPVPLKVTQLRIGQIKDTSQAQYYYITAYKIQVSDDNETWTDVYSGTGSKPATTLTANIADSGYHKYYRVYVTSAPYYSGYPRVFFYGIDFDAEAENAVFYDDEVTTYIVKTKKRTYYKNTELFDRNIINGITSEIGTVSYSGAAVYQSNAWDCFGYTRIGFKTNTATGSGQSEITFNEVQPAGFYTFKADNTQNGTATFSVTFNDGTTQTLAQVTAGSTKVPVAETRIYLSKPVAKAKVAFTSSNWGWSGGWSFAKSEEVPAEDYTPVTEGFTSSFSGLTSNMPVVTQVGSSDLYKVYWESLKNSNGIYTEPAYTSYIKKTEFDALANESLLTQYNEDGSLFVNPKPMYKVNQYLAYGESYRIGSPDYFFVDDVKSYTLRRI